MTTATERAGFEKWLLATRLIDPAWNEKRNCYFDVPYQLAFDAWQAARALAAPADTKSRGTALERFSELAGDEETDPIERLRFFCSMAMSDRDWLDAEPFFDAIDAIAAPADSAPVPDSLPAFIRRPIEQAIQSAVRPKGVGVHDGTIHGLASDKVAYLLRAYDALAAPRAPAPAPADSAPPGALETFTAYFVANYPGPNTIIHDPKWHAPKIFRAAEFAISSVAAPRAPAPTPTPTNIKQQIFEAAVVAHGVRFAVQKLPRPDVPSLEAIWVGVDKALAAPRAPAPDAELEIPDKPKLLRDFLAIAIEEWGHYPENTNGRKWVGAAQAAIAAAPAPDAGTEALRDALEIGLDLATAEAAKARELYGSYPKDGLGRKCVAADADVATIERALAALGAADQGAKNDI